MCHRFFTYVYFGFLIAVSGLFTGCQTAIEPYTGRTQHFLTSEQTEIQLGEEGWGEILEKETVSSDFYRKAAVDRVCRNIIAAVDHPSFDWEYRLFESEQANAYCLPGGKIGVYEGLFDYAANDAELATVIGHEVAHAIARHGGERMTQAMWISLGALGLAAALDEGDVAHKERWLAAYTGLTSVGYVLPYSRTHEFSADHLGLMYMARAGYDPQAAVDFWTKFSNASNTPALLEFLSTHPVGEHRIQELKLSLPKAYELYERTPVKRGFGDVFPE